MTCSRAAFMGPFSSVNVFCIRRVKGIHRHAVHSLCLGYGTFDTMLGRFLGITVAASVAIGPALVCQHSTRYLTFVASGYLYDIRMQPSIANLHQGTLHSYQTRMSCQPRQMPLSIWSTNKGIRVTLFAYCVQVEDVRIYGSLNDLLKAIGMRIPS
jgi:hypothetical protein